MTSHFYVLVLFDYHCNMHHESESNKQRLVPECMPNIRRMLLINVCLTFTKQFIKHMQNKIPFETFLV